MNRMFCLAAVCFAACKTAPEPPATPRTAVIVLGQDIDRTGSIATPSWADSIRLAVSTANQALKQAGRNLRFEVAEANSGNAPDIARSAALHLVKEQGAKAIITDSSQDDIALGMLEYDGDASHQLDVPVVCMACTSPAIDDPDVQDADPVRQAALRNGKGWNFRTAMSDAYPARLLVQVLAAAGDVNGDGRFKLSIYASDDPDGRGFSDAIRRDAQKARPGVIVEQVFHEVKADAAEHDWKADVAQVIDQRNQSTGKKDGLPDAVVEITFPKLSIGFTKAYLESGAKVRLVHAHNFRAVRVLETLKSAVEGQEGISQTVLGEGASAQVFSEDLKALTGQEPAFRDAAAYDAAATLMLAALVAARDHRLADPSTVGGAQIRDAMRAINDPQGEHVAAGAEGFARALRLIEADKPIDYEGASGPCDYDAHGDVVARLARFQVRGGRFADVDRFDCARDPSCPKVRTIVEMHRSR